MFSAKFNIPELESLYIEDFRIEMDIYKNLRCMFLVKSTNYEISDIVAILKMYNKVTVALDEVYLLFVTPGSARVEENDYLEIQCYGFIANLFKEWGYYTQNGSGLIDYTTLDINTGEAIGCYPIALLADVVKNTNFKLSYAPSVTTDGRIDTNNRIYVRGEWLNRAEWIYEVARNCFFYEYVGTDKSNAITGGIVPDFITAHKDDPCSGQLMDCCNVTYDEHGNIVVGVAGCTYLGNNRWKKMTTNITPYILSQDDTVFNFVEFDNAVVLGSKPGDDSTKRTYLAKPLTLEMYEVFTNEFNYENYEFEGLSKAQDDRVWQIVDDEYNQFLECEMWRSGTKKFRVYDFAYLKDLRCQFAPVNTFSIDISNESLAEPQVPTLDGYAAILGPKQSYRAGIFIGGDDYDKEWEGEESSKYWMRGYFFFLEQVNEYNAEGHAITKVYMRLRSGMNVYPTADGGANNPSPALALGDEIEVRDFTIHSSELGWTEEKLSNGYRLMLTIVPEENNGRVVALNFIMSCKQLSGGMETITRSTRLATSDTKRYLSKHEGRVGMFMQGHLNNFIYENVEDMEDEPFVIKMRFDNLQITCKSETLYGQVNKPIIMNRDRSVNVNTQGQLVALALFNQRNRQKDIKVTVDPKLFFERGIVPGQWVQIDYPTVLEGEYRICGINIEPNSVELCLNHSDMRNIDEMDGIKKYMDVLDSF